MEKKTTIRGHIILHDLNAAGGVKYLLYDIDPHEAKVFFDQAFSKGFAYFEDKMGYNYKLVYHGSEYKLIKQP